jgi:hypothetical protein
MFHERLNAINNRMWVATIGPIVLALPAPECPSRLSSPRSEGP